MPAQIEHRGVKDVRIKKNSTASVQTPGLWVGNTLLPLVMDSQCLVGKKHIGILCAVGQPASYEQKLGAKSPFIKEAMNS